MHGSDVSAEAVMIGRCRRMTRHQLNWCNKENKNKTISWALRSSDDGAESTLFDFEVRAILLSYLIFSLVKIRFLNYQMRVKAKPKIYFKKHPPEPLATEYVESPNSFIESQTLQK